MGKWQSGLIIAFAALLGGVWIALSGYFIRFGEAPLDYVSYSDALAYSIPFTIAIALCAIVAFILLYRRTVRYVTVGVLCLVPVLALVQHFTNVVPGVAINDDYATVLWGGLIFAVCLFAFSSILAADEIPVPMLAVSLLLLGAMVFMGGYGLALYKEARFYEWRDGKPIGYKLKWSYAQNDACHCGTGVIWMGDRATVLECAGRNYVFSSRETKITITPIRYREPAASVDTSVPLRAISPDYLTRTKKKLGRRCG